MFSTAAWPANLSYLFTIGSLKIEMFHGFVLKTAVPVELAVAHDHQLFSLLCSAASCHGEELFVIYHPSFCREKTS